MFPNMPQLDTEVWGYAQERMVENQLSELAKCTLAWFERLK
jgi:hypothetical protein